MYNNDNNHRSIQADLLGKYTLKGAPNLYFLSEIQSNLLSKYPEGHTKSLLLIRGMYLLSVY